MRKRYYYIRVNQAYVYECDVQNHVCHWQTLDKLRINRVPPMCFPRDIAEDIAYQLCKAGNIAEVLMRFEPLK